MEVGAALVKKAAELNLAGNMATLYRHDPLTAENQFRDMLFGDEEEEKRPDGR